MSGSAIDAVAVFQDFYDEEITDNIVSKAAILFSENYGVWGPLAESQWGEFAKAGRRIRVSPRMLRKDCPTPKDEKPRGKDVYIRVQIGGELAGNVLACRWPYDGGYFCWITQLVVMSPFRRKGLATRLLTELRQDNYKDVGYGVLSSHPATISAVFRAFGNGIENANLNVIRDYARIVMQSSSVSFVKEARSHGSLFGEGGSDGAVSTADTRFFVDHEEPMQTLAAIRERGVDWPFGELPEGHEYLNLVREKEGPRRTAEQADPTV